MCKFEIHYLPVAQQDLFEIFDYIRKDDPDAAAAFIDDLNQRISNLAEFPHMGRIPRDDGLRRLGYHMLVLGEYIVFYVVRAKTVEIRRIVHGRRRYGFLL